MHSVCTLCALFQRGVLGVVSSDVSECNPFAFLQLQQVHALFSNAETCKVLFQMGGALVQNLEISELQSELAKSMLQCALQMGIKSAIKDAVLACAAARQDKYILQFSVKLWLQVQALPSKIKLK